MRDDNLESVDNILPKKSYDNLLTNLRILGCIETDDFIGTLGSKDIYCRYSNNWWNTLSSAVRLETWNCTYECLQKIYVFDIPEYIDYLLDKDDMHKIKDLYRCCQLALKGIEKLKSTYSYKYQTINGGTYDQNFDTIIESYANIHITKLKEIIDC